MIIGIDGNEANVERKVGISEYAYQLLYYFSQFHKEGLDFRIYLKNSPRKELPKGNIHWTYTTFGPRPLWTQIALPMHLYAERYKPSVFFSPSHYAPRFSPVPTVISIMDLSYLYFPEMFKKSDLYQLKSWTAYSVKKASKILTISNSSKNDIIKEYSLPENKVAVTYPGVKPALNLHVQIYGMNELKKKYGISGIYILFVGTIQPRKNIAKLIEAFAKLVQYTKQQNSLQLVVIGKKGWLYDEIYKAPAEYKVEEKVKFLDFVPDEDLVAFYKNAVCYVLPSLYEGFGLPVLEAMKYDCPVITSNVSSLPEAGGDAALYVNPQDAGDIAEKIKMLLTNESLRKELIQKGKKQIEKFSWENTATETLEILEQVAKGS